MLVSSLIKSLGGAAAVARGIGLPAEVGGLRVRAWARREVIPGQYWAAIAAYAQMRGAEVTLEVLATAHSLPSQRAA